MTGVQTCALPISSSSAASSFRTSTNSRSRAFGANPNADVLYWDMPLDAAADYPAVASLLKASGAKRRVVTPQPASGY